MSPCRVTLWRRWLSGVVTSPSGQTARHSAADHHLIADLEIGLCHCDSTSFSAATFSRQQPLGSEVPWRSLGRSPRRHGKGHCRPRDRLPVSLDRPGGNNRRHDRRIVSRDRRGVVSQSGSPVPPDFHCGGTLAKSRRLGVWRQQPARPRRLRRAQAVLTLGATKRPANSSL